MRRQFFGWTALGAARRQKSTQPPKQESRSGFGATPTHHSRMVKHWADAVETNAKITAQALARRECRKATYSLIRTTLAVGALSAHVAACSSDGHMRQVLAAYRQDLINLGNRLAKCRRK